MTNPKNYLIVNPEDGSAKMKRMDAPRKPREENPEKQQAAQDKRDIRALRNVRLKAKGGF